MRKAQHVVGIQEGKKAHQHIHSNYSHTTIGKHPQLPQRTPLDHLALMTRVGCTTGPTGHLVCKVTLLRLGDIPDLLNI